MAVLGMHVSAITRVWLVHFCLAHLSIEWQDVGRRKHRYGSLLTQSAMQLSETERKLAIVAVVVHLEEGFTGGCKDTGMLILSLLRIGKHGRCRKKSCAERERQGKRRGKTSECATVAMGCRDKPARGKLWSFNDAGRQTRATFVDVHVCGGENGQDDQPNLASGPSQENAFGPTVNEGHAFVFKGGSAFCIQPTAPRMAKKSKLIQFRMREDATLQRSGERGGRGNRCLVGP